MSVPKISVLNLSLHLSLFSPSYNLPNACTYLPIYSVLFITLLINRSVFQCSPPSGYGSQRWMPQQMSGSRPCWLVLLMAILNPWWPGQGMSPLATQCTNVCLLCNSRCQLTAICINNLSHASMSWLLFSRTNWRHVIHLYANVLSITIWKF